jgi:hypothetical protein
MFHADLLMVVIFARPIGTTLQALARRRPMLSAASPRRAFR